MLHSYSLVTHINICTCWESADCRVKAVTFANGITIFIWSDGGTYYHLSTRDMGDISCVISGYMHQSLVHNVTLFDKQL